MSRKVILLVFTLLLLLRINYFQNGFVWFDHNDIEQGFAVLPLNRLYQAFTTPFGQTSFYRPIVVILNSFDYALYRSWAPGFHFTNIILFFMVVFASVLLILSYWKIEKKYIPLMVFFLGVHPVTIFISASINHRQESLLALLVIFTIYFLHRAIHDTKIKYILLGLLFWTLSLFTKETAIVIIPLAVSVMEGAYILRSFNKKAQTEARKNDLGLFIRRNLLLIAAFPIVTAVYALLRHYAVPAFWGVGYPNLALSSSIATRIGLFGNMIVQLLSPIKPNLSDAVPILSFSTLYVIVIILAVGGMFFYALIKGFERPIVRAFFLTLVMLLPGLDIIPVPRIGSPHYSYLALPAFCAMIFTFIQLQKNLLKKLFFVILITWIFIASYTTFISGRLFKNDEVLFTNETTKDPNFVEGYYYLGNFYLQKGDFQSALDNYNKADKDIRGFLYFKDSLSINFNRATTLMQLGKLDESYRLYEQIKKDAHYNLLPYITFNQALILYQQENYESSIKLLEGRTWDIPDAYLLLAKNYEKLGKPDKQEDVMQKLLQR